MLHVNCRSSSSCSCPSSTISSPHLSLQSCPDNCLHNDMLHTSPQLSYSSDSSAAELIKEIAALEVEVTHLERHLLSLYRKAFEHHLATLPSTIIEEGSRPDLPSRTESPSQDKRNEFCCHKDADVLSNDTVEHNGVAPEHGSVGSDNPIHPPPDVTPRMDGKNDDSGFRSLADYLGASLIDDIPETPDRLSEEIVRCISAIYCKLANPPLPQIGLSASPTSSLSSSSTFSPHDHWSSGYSEETPENPSQLKVEKDKNEPYDAMLEVLKICVDDERFNYAAAMLQRFRSLVQHLEKVDPRNMKREEKLSFWINIHNALVMHAYLAYGIHHNCIRSTSMVLKASYNVGGHSVNAYMIQSSILGCQLRHSSPWLQTLFSPGTKLKTGTRKHIYALDYPEPLVHFALCSGAYSDPAVRVYTAKNVFQELRVAKEEFVQVSVHIQKGMKIILPKILYYFAKDASLNLSGLLEMIHECVSETQKKSIVRCIKGRLDKHIAWAPQDSAFRYMIHRDLAKERVFM
ncbi:PREDICTED: uncharacterized protein LOC104606899 isoform X2 [Nelumbo nucifera]|uniref:Uncharacterized protein LOC104606899 isoform X2 n=1 Tax=Nelumbo nucifera TaxID=4432 RepID=A0A1U8B4D5_NELNU|nr:PREDICTED: uncharacterized protein LOC104606899 isoform X2 [Nelumbo nucifera]